MVRIIRWSDIPGYRYGSITDADGFPLDVDSYASSKKEEKLISLTTLDESEINCEPIFSESESATEENYSL